MKIVTVVRRIRRYDTDEHKEPLMTDKPTANDDSAAKDPSDWTTGDEPATAAQLSYLQTLAQETNQEIPENITKADASELIDKLQGESDRVKG